MAHQRSPRSSFGQYESGSNNDVNEALGSEYSSPTSPSSPDPYPGTGDHSTSALILVPNSAGPSSTAFFDDDPLYSGEEDEGQSSFACAGSIPPLHPSSVLLYLLSPHLRLGALLLAQTPTSFSLALKVAVPAFAVLAALSRQIVYMLGRYVRKADWEEVVVDAFARGRGRGRGGAGRERRRKVVRGAVRACMGALKVLLATVYLRESTNVLLPMFPETSFIPPRVLLTLILSLLLLPLLSARALDYKQIVCSTWASVGLYLIWMGLTIFGLRSQVRANSTSELRVGSLWQGITTVAFAFTSSSTLPLYAALKGTVHSLPTTTPTPKKQTSFKLLLLVSAVLGALLILPLTFWSGSSDLQASDLASDNARAFLTASILLLSVPSIVITCPTVWVPASVRRATRFPVSKAIVCVVVVCLSLVPEGVERVLTDLVLAGALAGTYAIPALVHIVTHQFKTPLSIVIPPRTPSPESAAADELLMRKERALQRRRMLKRIGWDVGVWVLLVPVSGGGLVWAGGRVGGRW